jgi:hypothetical protein
MSGFAPKPNRTFPSPDRPQKPGTRLRAAALALLVSLVWAGGCAGEMTGSDGTAPVDGGARDDSGPWGEPRTDAGGPEEPVADDSGIDDVDAGLDLDGGALDGGTDPVCIPSSETCNAADDDCDGMVDEALGATTCGVGACARTVDVCVAGSLSTCEPGAPSTDVCNGVDDDCDGAVDDDGVCEPGCGGLGAWRLVFTRTADGGDGCERAIYASFDLDVELAATAAGVELRIRDADVPTTGDRRVIYEGPVDFVGSFDTATCRLTVDGSFPYRSAGDTFDPGRYLFVEGRIEATLRPNVVGGTFRGRTLPRDRGWCSLEHAVDAAR